MSSNPHGLNTGSNFVAPTGAISSRERRLLIGLLTGAAIVGLDFFIALACLKSIEASMGASSAQLQLVMAAYSICNGSLLIMGGRLGDLMGRRRVFVLGLGLYALGSAACGLATSITGLILFRALQGVAGALLQPQVLGLLTINFDASKRQQVFGLYAAALGFAGIFAQLVGGVLVEWLPLDLGWRVCFWLAIPLCALAAWMSSVADDGPQDNAMRPPHPVRKESSGQATWSLAGSRLPDHAVDYVGALALSVALGCLSSVLTVGREADWPSWTWLVLGIGVASGLFFRSWQSAGARSGAARILPAGLLSHNRLWLALATVMVFYAGVASFYFVLALELRGPSGLSPVQVGLVFAWLGTCFVLTSSSAGLKRWVGPRWALVGMAALGVGHAGIVLSAVALTGMGQLAGLLLSIVPQGVGLGLLMGPLMAQAVSRVEAKHASLGGGLAAATQQIGNSLGICAIGVAYYAPSLAHADQILAAMAYLIGLLALLALLHRFTRFTRFARPGV